MAGHSLYHINPQRATVLLQPVQTSVHELEARLQHYINRLPFASDADQQTLTAAHAALATARQELDRLLAGQAGVSPKSQ